MIKAALEGYNSLYISINQNLPEKRIKDFLYEVPNNKINEIYNSRIKILNFFNFNDFCEFFDDLHEILHNNNINIIFIDSIAALLETEFTDANGDVDFQKRNNFLTT